VIYRSPQARNQGGKTSPRKIFALSRKNVLDVFWSYWT